MRLRRKLVTTFIGGALLALTIPGAAAFAADDGTNEPGPSVVIPPSSHGQPAKFIPADELPDDVGPLPTDEFLNWVSDIQQSFASQDAFGQVEIRDDQRSIKVYLHGKPSAAILAKLEAAPAQVTSEIVRVKHLPGQLRREADRLIRQQLPSAAGGRVTATYPNNDFSGITVEVERDPSANASLAGMKSAIIAASSPSVPASDITVIDGVIPEPAALSRSNDPYRSGGAYFYSSEGLSCTTGFAVMKNDQSEQGMMTAEHCGSVGSLWGHMYEGTSYYYGDLAAEVHTHDGAIVRGAPTYSATVWFGTLASSNRYGLYGPWPMSLGAKICYSGSKSGTVCSNTVTQAGYNQLMADGSYRWMYKTENDYGTPAAGNGDSGGPAVVLTAAPGGGSHIRPAGITSAILNGTTNCTGTPGDPGPNGRKCSSTVLATSVGAIEDALGWTIMHQ